MHVYERYVGLRGQPRIGLVDRHGRVHHYDVEEWERLMTEHDPTAMDPEEPLQGGDVEEPEPTDLPDKPPIEDMPGEDEEPPSDEEEAEDEKDIEFLDDGDAEDDDTVDNQEQAEMPNENVETTED